MKLEAYPPGERRPSSRLGDDPARVGAGFTVGEVLSDPISETARSDPTEPAVFRE